MTADFRLMPSQQNKVLEVIQEAGLSPADFEWRFAQSRETETGDSIPISMLTHKESGYSFEFDRFPNRFGGDPIVASHYSPGNESLEDRSTANNWVHQCHQFAEWLGYLARELEAPDLWGSLPEPGRRLLESVEAAELGREPFTVEEQQALTVVLNDIKVELFQQFDFSPSQSASIEEGFEELKKATPILGRRFWITSVVGLLVAWVTSGILTSDRAEWLWKTLGEKVGEILKLLE